MHALVGIYTLEPSGLEALRRDLHERVVPLFRFQPGFVSASWSCDVDAGKAFSVIVLESDSYARKLVDFVRAQAARSGEAGPRLEALFIVEVLAEAQRTRRESC